MIQANLNTQRPVNFTRTTLMTSQPGTIVSPKKAIEDETVILKIRQVIANAHRLGDTDMLNRAERHLSTFVGFQDTALDNRFLECVKRYEETLSEKNGKKTHATRLRQSVARKGVTQTLVSLAKKPEPSFGFEQLIKAGQAEFTAEYLIVDVAEMFTAETVRSAYQKLIRAGYKFSSQQ